jgi:hypothetical protein
VIHLCTLCVADEDLGVVAVSKLVDMPKLLHDCSAAEHAQVAHLWLSTMLDLIGRATDKNLGQKSVLQVDCGHHRLSPTFHRHSPLLQERTHHCHHRLILPLHHPVLLWGVWCREVPHDSLVSAVGGELGGRDLPTVISPLGPELEAALLYHHLNASDGTHHV